MQRLFIAGCGYTGERVATTVLARGWEVIVQVRDEEKAARLRQRGLSVICCAMDRLEEVPSLLLDGHCLLYSIPPQGGGSIDLRARAFCAALERDRLVPRRIVYLSATSVYGDTGGAAVTETSPTEPASAMGKRRLDAEARFHEFAAHHGIPLVILRIAGIYGPGRLPLMQITQGQPLLREEEARPSNRIHIDDLVQVCATVLETGSGVYNISDGAPSSMTSYFNACADALGLPRQPQVSLDEARRTMPPLLFNYFVESRVVDNSRMLRDLGIVLRYPDMVSGVAAAALQTPKTC
ncbi:SDR family oxidoreductase [Trichlorobacter ammonificans]|uniref:NAD-dependent epimerase/dehydratase n=1 Tax=Trichlorobacter ammonificans TaxID=2916410 RepID=A0ABN8HM40_9BACT|nr:SDR family oxidoreductase [Trichlorobacter ammonificans]CAH2032306.1 NAD-dependent epimerase/dehydratase [Trichlorobacter ammonificans]